MGTTVDAVIGSISKTVEWRMYNLTIEKNPPKADYCCGRGNSKPKKGYYSSNEYYPKH